MLIRFFNLLTTVSIILKNHHQALDIIPETLKPMKLRLIRAVFYSI